MMPFRSPRLAAAAVAFATAAVVGVAGTALADLTVKGDQAAWQQVLAAFAKLHALPGYRMKSVIPGGSWIVEVAASGAMHTMMHMQNGSVESYTVNGQSRTKEDIPGAPRGWQCTGTPSPMMASPTEPTKVQGAVEVARGGNTTIDGQPVHTYVYTVQSRGRSSKQTLYIGAANGLPRRIVLATPQGDRAADFYDYGAPIQFTLPACGSP